MFAVRVDIFGVPVRGAEQPKNIGCASMVHQFRAIICRLGCWEVSGLVETYRI